MLPFSFLEFFILQLFFSFSCMWRKETEKKWRKSSDCGYSELTQFHRWHRNYCNQNKLHISLSFFLVFLFIFFDIQNVRFFFWLLLIFVHCRMILSAYIILLIFLHSLHKEEENENLLVRQTISFIWTYVCYSSIELYFHAISVQSTWNLPNLNSIKMELRQKKSTKQKRNRSKTSLWSINIRIQLQQRKKIECNAI